MNDHDNMFCHRKFRGTFSSVNMLKGYMLICWNAEGVHGQRKVGNGWVSKCHYITVQQTTLHTWLMYV